MILHRGEDIAQCAATSYIAMVYETLAWYTGCIAYVGENGYSILKARVKGYDDLVTLVGNMLDVTVGTVLVADGQWKVNRQYGGQFVVENIIEHDSKRLAEVDSIGPKRIRKIHDSWMK